MITQNSEPVARLPGYLVVEEICNSISHGLGAVAAITGLIIGILTLSVPVSSMVGFIIYSSSLILLMLISTLYHALIFSRAKKVFRALDRCAIYAMIAGSFTPFILTLYGGWLRTILLSLVWGLTALWIVVETALPRFAARSGSIPYIAFGWMGTALFPMIRHLPGSVVWLVLAGGVLYTLGAVMMLIKKPFIHTAWHAIVLAAAGSQYLAIIRLG